MTDRIPTHDGGFVRARTWGRAERPALLLLRALGGGTTGWDRLAAELEPRFFVISFDHRGRGESSPLPPWASTRTLAEDALAVLDYYECERIHLFGLSLGGMVAMRLAHLWPRRIDRLALGSTPARGRRVDAASLRQLASMSRCLWRSPADAEACLVSQVVRADPTIMAEEQRLARANAKTRLELLKLMMVVGLHDMTGVRLHVPTLVLAGERDDLVSVTRQRSLARQLGAPLRTVPEAGHDLVTEAPLAVAPILIEHFERHD